MKKAIENAPARGRGRAGGQGNSPGGRRLQAIEALEKAHEADDKAKLGELIEQMKRRFKS